MSIESVSILLDAGINGWCIRKHIEHNATIMERNASILEYNASIMEYNPSIIEYNASIMGVLSIIPAKTA